MPPKTKRIIPSVDLVRKQIAEEEEPLKVDVEKSLAALHIEEAVDDILPSDDELDPDEDVASDFEEGEDDDLTKLDDELEDVEDVEDVEVEDLDDLEDVDEDTKVGDEEDEKVDDEFETQEVLETAIEDEPSTLVGNEDGDNGDLVGDANGVDYGGDFSVSRRDKKINAAEAQARLVSKCKAMLGIKKKTRKSKFEIKSVLGYDDAYLPDDR